MRAAVERRPEDEVHGPVPCTPATFDLTLATDALLRQLLSLDFSERQILLAPENVAVTRETRHSLKIEWVAPPSIPSFPVCGYSILVSEDDGTPEGGHPEQEMRGFQRDRGDREAESGGEQAVQMYGHDEVDQYSSDEDESGYDTQRRQQQPDRSSVSRQRARSADRSRQPRPASSIGSGHGHGGGSNAVRRSRSADRVRRSGDLAPTLAQDSQSSLAKHKLAVAKQQRRNDNAPLLRFEAWGLKADTPYRFHIQAANGQGRGLWVRHHPYSQLSQSALG